MTMSEIPVAEVLVVSDLHAMSPDVDVVRFMRFVDAHPARQVVLAGDILDLYLWRHGRGRVDVQAGVDVLRYLLALVERGVELVILPGNHDLDWAWLKDGARMPRRMRWAAFPDGMRALMEQLVAHEHVTVVHRFVVGNAVVVHGHEGWQGDWLWRVSEFGDRMTRYRMVGGELRRNVMGGAPVGLRAVVVEGHGFYRRLAGWARKVGVAHVIHGHTHIDGRRVRGDVVIDCLPAWRMREGRGGGMVLRGGVWERLVCGD